MKGFSICARCRSLPKRLSRSQFCPYMECEVQCVTPLFFRFLTDPLQFFPVVGRNRVFSIHVTDSWRIALSLHNPSVTWLPITLNSINLMKVLPFLRAQWPSMQNTWFQKVKSVSHWVEGKVRALWLSHFLQLFVGWCHNSALTGICTWTLEQIAQRAFGVALIGDTQELSGLNPGLNLL